jgi:hypothetical protein
LIIKAIEIYIAYEKGIPFRIFGEKITPYHSAK